MVFARSDFGPLPLSCWTFCVNEKTLALASQPEVPPTSPRVEVKTCFVHWLYDLSFFIVFCFLFCALFPQSCWSVSVVISTCFRTFSTSQTLRSLSIVMLVSFRPSPKLSEKCHVLHLHPSVTEVLGGGTRDSQVKLRPCKWIFRLVQNQMKQRVGGGRRPCDHGRNKYFTLTELR